MRVAVDVSNIRNVQQIGVGGREGLLMQVLWKMMDSKTSIKGFGYWVYNGIYLMTSIYTTEE